MVETTVHVHGGKLEIEIKDDKVIRFTLEPNDALNLGIKLLRAAYATKV
ncbi:MAG: hypothetical protein ACE5HG_01070 [Candidatus Bathyarchaeia archaeon]